MDTQDPVYRLHWQIGEQSCSNAQVPSCFLSVIDNVHMLYRSMDILELILEGKILGKYISNVLAKHEFPESEV